MILLIGNYAHDRQESMQRFARMLFDGLSARGIPVELLAPQPFFGRLKPAGHGIGKWLGYLDKYLIFPIQLRRRIRQLRSPSAGTSTSNLNPLVVHVCDHSNASYTRYLQHVAHLVTCNDVLALRSARGDFSENPTGFTGRIYQKLILRGLQRAQHVVCISSNTKAELMEIAGVSSERIKVVEMGLNYPYDPMQTREARGVVDQVLELRGFGQFCNSPFLMHIGGNQWYKNRIGLVRLYLELASMNEPSRVPPLFLLGTEPTAEMKALISSRRGKVRIVPVGKVSNQELHAFYSLAEALVFPSKREGFGWPIIEAQACGCRVATSDRAPMNDIGGDAAVYFDPEDAAGAAETVAKLLRESDAARHDRIERGLFNVQRFSTDRMIDGYLRSYQMVKDNGESRRPPRLGALDTCSCPTGFRFRVGRSGMLDWISTAALPLMGFGREEPCSLATQPTP
jgi:glycosyltransferase involved in cell wall biosynthesis